MAGAGKIAYIILEAVAASGLSRTSLYEHIRTGELPIINKQIDKHTEAALLDLRLSQEKLERR